MPEARYAHSAVYYAKKNFLLIYGGKNDDVNLKTTVSLNCLFKDIWICHLETLAWSNIEVDGL